MLYAGSNDNIEKEFEQDVSNRFDVNFLGPAQLLLQMRIHQHNDQSYTLDQHRFALNTTKRYDPDNHLTLRDAPLPPDYIFTKTNNPQNEQYNALISTQFPNVHFCSAVCTLLYLAYNTRADMLFAVCKLAKACVSPGLADYKVLIWLLGYIKNVPDLAIKFHPDGTDNPIYNICLTNRLPYSDVVIFTNASWQDCPDTGCSTIGHAIFHKGTLIEASSSIPFPIAMSTSEAEEYMGACCGAMATAHLRMLLYDMMYLGTKEWKQTHQILPTTPALLMIDNESTVQIAKTGRLT